MPLISSAPLPELYTRSTRVSEPQLLRLSGGRGFSQVTTPKSSSDGITSIVGTVGRARIPIDHSVFIKPGPPIVKSMWLRIVPYQGNVERPWVGEKLMSIVPVLAGAITIGVAMGVDDANSPAPVP